jgi:hypothetical protein
VARNNRSPGLVKASLVLILAAALGPLTGLALINSVIESDGWATIIVSFLLIPGVISWQIGSRVGTRRLGWTAAGTTAAASIIALLLILIHAGANGAL